MQSQELNIAVCAICRNEVDYIEEWVAYYKTSGFDSIYIYDNVSDDGSTELLAAMDAVGLIHRIHWPRKEGIPPQRDAYGDFINRFSHQHDYVLVCDLDEFLVVNDGSVKTLIAEAESRHDDVGAIAFPWLIFGSGGADKKSDGLIIERFTHCEKTPSRTVKTMYRTRNVYNMRTHICDLLNGVYLDNNLEVAEWDQKMPIRLHKVKPGKALMHHYYTKSREEWVRRRAQPKADRGGVELKNLEEFEKYNSLQNVVVTAMAKVNEVTSELEFIRNVLEDQEATLGGGPISLIAVNGDWIFAVVMASGVQSPITIRFTGDSGFEEYFYTKPVASTYHLLTVKTKWRDFYSEGFTLSVVGLSKIYKFAKVNFPTAEESFLELMSFASQADEHIFTLFLTALTNENFEKIISCAVKLKTQRNIKFEMVISALRAYQQDRDASILKESCSLFDPEFTKKLSSGRGSKFLSRLLK